MGLSFDRIADRYDSTRGYPENIMEDILGALEGVLRKDDLVLDAGVGTGRFAQPLQARGFDVVGVDISPRMLRKAREKGTEDILRADVCALPFGGSVFGTALSVHVLHLISNWRCALQEISRVTAREFVSVAFNREESPAEELRRFYDDACEELGFKVCHPGLRERELPEILPPDTSRTIVTHEHPIDVEDMISDFETRTYSSQWTVPDEIHERAIERLRERYGGVEQIMGHERISLITWDIGRVRRFVAGRP
ncbi:MAG: hypothetical protein A3K67_04045 [Euryarchaeota archaeon RBG_16_62_10]|nr:MAG: hypothetical protein A3K67_04045 [Euryarchaeota archaeon RBG_16_62_10]